MKICLSKDRIESFCGNVLPLRLLGVEEFGMEEITWRVEGDCLDLKTFTEPAFNQCDDGDFTDGVLLTLLTPGEAKVIATYQGIDYVCHVVIREMKKSSSDDDFEYFLGDLHVHTSTACGKPNNRFILTTRADGTSPFATVKAYRDAEKFRFHVITDHASLLNRREFFRGFLAEEESGENMVTFAGSECDIFSIERDRYGILRDNANEVVCINAANYACAYSYRDFMDAYNKCPFMVCTLAHPHNLSYGTVGKGDFSLYKNCSARFRQMIKYVEIGDGTDRSGNLVNEYMYSVALDSGFRVSTTCSSDAHSRWAYDRCPGKTVMMAKENSREAFLDALMSGRVYACMSANVKLRYSVNGHTAPATLPMAKTYRFHLETSYFEDIPDTRIVAGEVISNGGVTLKKLEGDFSNMDFEITSNTASWFYLRLWDSQGRKTWSVPVFTGREPYLLHNDDLEPLDKRGVTVLDEKAEKSASVLVCDDPFRPWMAGDTTASLLIDLQKEETICGLGHYNRVLIGKFMKEVGDQVPSFWAGCPFRYAISTSLDGESFTTCAEGVFRTFSGEEIVRFPKHNARYIRLEILSTVGQNSHREEFEHEPLTLGELTVYRKLEKAEMHAQFRDRIERYGNHLLKMPQPEETETV